MNYVSKLREAYESWDNSKGTNHEKWLELMSDHVVFRSLAGGTPGMEFTKEWNASDLDDLKCRHIEFQVEIQ